MVDNHQMSGAAYRAQLVNIVQRAQDLETRARTEYAALNATDPQYRSWVRIERRYATVRGNAQHLLLIHDQRRRRKQPLNRILRYLHLL